MRRITALIVLCLPISSYAHIDVDLDGNEVIDGRDIFAYVALFQAHEPESATGTQVGWVAELEGQSPTYGVSGSAVVTSATSIRLENFSYLNNGPDVFLYLITAAGGGDFTPSEGAAGLSIHEFSNNDSEPFSNVTMNVDLPEGIVIQPYTHISVWCRQFSANFGSGRFGPAKSIE